MSEASQPAGRALPRLAMLREMTDRAVLAEVLAHGRITRAELADRTGISRPTAFESVRRLEGAGVLLATGSQVTGRRGRVATFYELAPAAGYVIALEISQRGIRACAADLAGQAFHEQDEPPVRPGDVAALVEAVRAVVRRALAAGDARHGAVRVIALSVANPVDPRTRDIIALPDSPFPEGLLRPGELLAGLVEAPLVVDNDVNWAALAERRTGAAREAESFAYVHVGGGLGASLYLGDQLVRGAHGLAGEIGYLSTASTAGEHTTLAGTLARQGFGRADAPSNDVPAVLDTIARAVAGAADASAAVRTLGVTIGHAIAATCAIMDPELVLLGGPIGSQPAVLESTRASVAELAPTPVRIEPGSLGDAAPLRGALTEALDQARAQLIA